MTDFKLYTDGACRGNPGVGACAFLLTRDDEEVIHKAVYVGHCTNNIAEYCGVLYGLISVIMSDVKTLTVVSDSELIIKQLNGDYVCNKQELQFFHEQVGGLVKEHFNKVEFKNVKRDDIFISRCDKYCNELLDRRKT